MSIQSISDCDIKSRLRQTMRMYLHSVGKHAVIDFWCLPWLWENKSHIWLSICSNVDIFHLWLKSSTSGLYRPSIIVSCLVFWFLSFTFSYFGLLRPNWRLNSSDLESIGFRQLSEMLEKKNGRFNNRPTLVNWSSSSRSRGMSLILWT